VFRKTWHENLCRRMFFAIALHVLPSLMGRTPLKSLGKKDKDWASSVKPFLE